MRVNMFLVHMSADDESVFSLRQRHRQLIADFVCQLRRDLSRLERLPQVLGDYILFLLVAPGHRGVLPL